MAERYGRGPLSLPIDYLQVGLLRDRTSTPMGLLTLDAGATLTSEQFLHKVKTVALRQLPVTASVPAQDIEVFVKWARLSGGVLLHAGYIGPLTTPVTDDVDAFVRNVCVYNKPLQVEVWKKSDLGSPSHCYQRSTRPMLYFSAAQTPAPAFATVKVEATQLEDNAKPAPTVRHFSAPLLTAQCVRAFRKDLDRQVIVAAGVRDTDNTKVDIYFKIKGAAQKDASSKTGKSKESFEEGVLACIAKRKPIKIQFRIRSTQEASKKCRDDVASTGPAQPVVPPKTLVQAADRPVDGFSFGTKTAFGRQPASTSPAPVSLPSAGSAFDQFTRAEPLRMTSAGSATSFRTLHEGFYESVRQAAAVHSPAPKAPPMASESQRTIKTESNAQKVPALRQVESLLSSFLVNLNQTLLDNFGDNSSTLTLSDTTKHKAQSTKTSAGQPGVRHNATCNLCKAVVVGTRHKCANCPDWDCCDKCRSMAAQLHPGHLLMAIDSLSVIRGSVRSKNLSRHPNILCDGCDEPIVGPRFKCIACDDFDWCDNCEADPVKKHDKGDHHVFLKINRPLADSERVAHFALQGHALVQEMQYSLGREQEPSLRQREEMQQVRDSTTTLAGRDRTAAVASASAPTPTQEVRAEEPARLSPDPFQEAVEAIKADIKKRSQRTGEDDLLHAAENKRVATEKCMEEKSTEKSTTETDMDDIQKRLAALSSDAQKLPGSDYVPADSPIKVASSSNDEDREEYDMRVLGDVNMPDGTAVVAGSQFEKIWSVKNTGRKTWPASTAIQLTSSSGGIPESTVCSPNGKTVSSGEIVQVAVGDLEAGESLGDHHLYFRLQLPGVGGGQGKRFGQQLWCQVHVVDGSGANSMGASSYLSATNDKGAVNKDETQGSGALSEHWAGSSLGSSLFQLPNAPESVATTSERDQGPVTSATTTTTETDDVDDLSFASSDDDGDDDYEIIDPTSSDDDTDEP